MQQLYSKFCIENGQLRAKLVWKTMSWLVRVIKQIVELCKIYKNMNATTTEDYARREVALKILDLLEIEEVNE